MINSTSFQKHNHNNEIEKSVLHNLMHSALIPMGDVKTLHIPPNIPPYIPPKYCDNFHCEDSSKYQLCGIIKFSDDAVYMKPR